jgi:hypothetical protein
LIALGSLLNGPMYHVIRIQILICNICRQKLWDQLNSDKDVAAKLQVLMAKSEEEKLHSMLDEK